MHRAVDLLMVHFHRMTWQHPKDGVQVEQVLEALTELPPDPQRLCVKDITYFILFLDIYLSPNHIFDPP